MAATVIGAGPSISWSGPEPGWTLAVPADVAKGTIIGGPSVCAAEAGDFSVILSIPGNRNKRKVTMVTDLSEIQLNPEWIHLTHVIVT